jgi:single-strand DNA-binding protein
MYSQTTLIGRLTKDPEAREVTINGEQTWVCNFSVATDDRGKTDYHDIVVWRKLAENCKNFLAKGRMVAVIGKNKKRSYENQAGATVWVTEVIADDVRFLSSKNEGQGGGQSQPAQPQGHPYQPTQNPTGFPQQQQNDPYAGGINISDDSLPF